MESLVGRGWSSYMGVFAIGSVALALSLPGSPAIGGADFVSARSVFSADSSAVVATNSNEPVSGGGDGDTCGATTPHLVEVPGSVTIIGDSTGTTGPDLCITSNPLNGNIWWFSFEITECADVIVDFCETSPAVAVWLMLTQCNGGSGCSDFIFSDSFSGALCGDGNDTMGFFQVPPGTYYVPFTVSPGQGGPFQAEISTTVIPCMGGCCSPDAGTCEDDVERVDCSLPGQQFTHFEQCCEIECRDPAGPEFDSSGVTLLSRVSIEDFADFAGTPANPHRGNDIWGYTSPAGREYAIMGFTTGTGYVDVTDPANPAIVEFINDGVDAIWRDMAIFGDHAYVVADDGALGLMIVDLTDIDAGNVTVEKTTQLGEGLVRAHNIYINAASETLYLCLPNHEDGLWAFSLADPLNPALSGRWTDTVPNVRCHDVQVITYTGGPNAGKEIAFCFAEDDGPKIVDVTDKTAMITLSTLTYPNLAYCHQGWLSEDGQYLIFGDERDEDDGLVPRMTTYVADISDLSAPTLASTYEFDTCNIDHNQMVRGHLVFQANNSTGLHVLDFSSPPTLVQVAHFDTRPEDNVTAFLGAWGVFTDYASEIVVLSDRQRGLFVFGIPDLGPGCHFTEGDLFVATSGDDVLSGTTPGSAKQTIQAAIEAATPGDFIVVGPGTYDENINFNGKAITLRSACGPVVTTIDAGGSGSVVTCQSGETSDTVLEGFTITGGNAGNGGGMFNQQFSSPTVTNCTFSGNSAIEGFGGGMYNAQSNPTVTNCTFSGNSAVADGGEMYNAESNPTVTNCILWGVNLGPPIFGTAMVSFSDVNGGFDGPGNINADPMFVRHPDPGPDGNFDGIDDDNGDLRLLATSPCIDAGNDSAVDEPTDLDGNTRVLGCAVDMGAYELQAIADTDGDGVPDVCDPCPVDNPDDSDGDGVCNSDDICPRGPDNIDNNGNGVPDACDVEPPVFPQAPHDILKNRYISIDPRGADQSNVGKDLDIRLTLTSTLVNGVTVVGSQWWASAPDAACIAIVGATRPAVPPIWDACPTLHLTGCPIIPTSSYDIVVIDGATMSDPPLPAATQAQPGPKWHGDCVGFFTGTEWTAPNRQTSIDDAVAAIKTFQNPSATPGCPAPPCNATHTSVTDMKPNLTPGAQINSVVNIADVFSIILGFQGQEYPGPQIALCP